MRNGSKPCALTHTGAPKVPPTHRTWQVPVPFSPTPCLGGRSQCSFTPKALQELGLFSTSSKAHKGLEVPLPKRKIHLKQINPKGTGTGIIALWGAQYNKPPCVPGKDFGYKGLGFWEGFTKTHMCLMDLCPRKSF